MRMEILKLKRALYMKSLETENITPQEVLHFQVHEEDPDKTPSRHGTLREYSPIKTSSGNTVPSEGDQVAANNRCIGQLTFSKNDFILRQHMSTVDELREETETKEMDELDRYLRE